MNIDKTKNPTSITNVNTRYVYRIGTSRNHAPKRPKTDLHTRSIPSEEMATEETRKEEKRSGS